MASTASSSPRRPRPERGGHPPNCTYTWSPWAPTTAASQRWKLPLKCSFLSSRKSDYISPLDDLAFDMYQDPEVAQIIRKLDERKREAVQKERYDYAKKLKQAIADLQKVLLRRSRPPRAWGGLHGNRVRAGRVTEGCRGWCRSQELSPAAGPEPLLMREARAAPPSSAPPAAPGACCPQKWWENLRGVLNLP